MNEETSSAVAKDPSVAELDFGPCPCGVAPPLDPEFIPLSLVMKRYRELLDQHSRRTSLILALEREGGHISRHTLETIPLDQAYGTTTLRLVERIVKFLLWARGGWRLYIAGAPEIGEHIRRCYASDGERAFDVSLMHRVYERPLEVVVTDEASLPASAEKGDALGGHWDGCRIGFDLGASDYKIAAVIDGIVQYSEEIPWNPRVEPDPCYHYNLLRQGLVKAANVLPRVDAIGGSSAGVIVENRVMVASLFRSVPANVFEERVKPMFAQLQAEWNVPLRVLNDGDVTAVAGALSLEKESMLGIAMGSSEATGFVSGQGRIMGWLNELAFTPLDFNARAVPDEWSGDRGVGALYFSQQAVNKLAEPAGITFSEDVGLPDRLKAVQEKVNAGDEAACRIFETIGVYLGYALPWYSEFYDFENVLILGRVTSGSGGEIIMRTARQVLHSEFPALAETLALHVPDEKSRRVGQAVAAASLPEIRIP